MKLRQPRISHETKVRIITDYAGGMKIKDILTRYKIAQGSLYRILKEKVL